tara:strand:- start:116 stop:655 length:540 start_codon:yes stop_codon:yes gene_type:complete
MIRDITFLHFLTTTSITELLFLYLIRFTTLFGKKINNWYTNLRLTAALLDFLSFIIGFYLAKISYVYLVDNNYISNHYEFIKFLIIMLIIQIVHDVSFYFLAILPTKSGINIVMDEFKKYTIDSNIVPILGDSLMYLIATPILFYLILNLNNDTNIFISILSIYIIIYLVYQKPYIKMN